MCLYKIEDVPATVTKDTKLPEPIMCHNWDSHFEYNFDKKTFERHKGKGLHPYCASQTPMNPAEAWRKENAEAEKNKKPSGPQRITIDLNTLEPIAPPAKDSAAPSEVLPGK
jgi:hypothetical protein